MRKMATVDRIQIITAQTNLVAAVAAGEAALPVLGVAEFSEDGGSLNVGGYVVEGEIVDGLNLDYDSADPDANTVTLSAVLGVGDDLADRTAVYPLPVVQRKVASVILAEEHESGDTVEANVPAGSLWADTRLAEGTTPGQSVIVETDTWTVVGFDDGRPSYDAKHIADSTLPAASVNIDDWTDNALPVTLLTRDSAHHPDLSIIGGSIQSSVDGSGNQRVINDPDGFRLLDATGKPILTVPTAANARPHITGRVDADSFAGATGAFTQQLDVAAGATLALKKSTQPPATPPVTTTFYDFISIPDMDVNNVGGMVHDGTDFWFVYSADSDIDTWLCRLDVTAGVGTLNYQYPLTPFRGYFFGYQKLALIAGTFYVMLWQSPAAPFTIVPVDAATGTIGTAYQYARRTTSTMFDIALGDDGTHLLVAEPTVDFIKVTELNPATGIATLTATLPPLPGAGIRTLAGIQQGSFDLGSTRYVVWAYSELHRKALVAKADLSDWDDTLNFRYGNNENPTCACWAAGLDGGRFASFSTVASGIWIYGQQPFDGEGVPIYVTTSLRNDTHDYDTPIGPYATLQGHQRGGIRVNAGTVPGSGGTTDPEFYQAWYTTHDITTAAPADWSLLGDCDATTGDLAVLDLGFGFEGSPATNTFPTGDLAALESDDGTALIRADKTGLIFDLITAAASGGGTGYDDFVYDLETGDLHIYGGGLP